jgi:hypothetical protein
MRPQGKTTAPPSGSFFQPISALHVEQSLGEVMLASPEARTSREFLPEEKFNKRTKPIPIHVVNYGSQIGVCFLQASTRSTNSKYLAFISPGILRAII